MSERAGSAKKQRLEGLPGRGDPHVEDKVLSAWGSVTRWRVMLRTWGEVHSRKR